MVGVNPGHGYPRGYFLGSRGQPLVRQLAPDSEDHRDNGHAHHVTTCRGVVGGLLPAMLNGLRNGRLNDPSDSPWNDPPGGERRDRPNGSPANRSDVILAELRVPHHCRPPGDAASRSLQN